MENEKILFMDIDGCLTTPEDGSSYTCCNPETYGYSESKISLIKKIIEKTGCKIIVSSNWRRFPDDGKWIQRFGSFSNPLPRIKKELGNAYIGDLTHERHLTKSEALELWFEDNGISKSKLKYLIIDDDLDEGFARDFIFSKHYIHCQWQTGLTEEQAEKIISIFSE